jgi:hypothetical protein
VNKNSILNVSSQDRTEYGITVQEFVRLTAPNPAMHIDDYDSYIISQLTGLGIGIGLKTTDDTITEKTL